MDCLDEDECDLASSHEALIEFLYLTPVGIIKFRPDGTIDMANPTAAQLLMPLATDGDMSDLYQLLSGLAPDLQMHVKRYQPDSGQIFDQMQVLVPNTETTLMLEINKINAKTFMAVIQDISDLTAARRDVVRRTDAQRLLGSVFMLINTPVVVVRADGFILLSNRTFQNLMGYDSKSITGLNIGVLLPPDHTGAVQAARSQQMLDGGCYSLPIEVVLKNGTRVRMTMNSSLLRETDSKHLRVITLTEEAAAGAPGIGPGSVTQVEVLSFASVREAVGDEWIHIRDRGLALAEKEVKQLLGAGDILKRGKGDCFVIWFVDSDCSRNAALLNRAKQAVARVFVTEFSSKVRARVEAATR